MHGVERGLLPATAVARTEDRMLMLLERLDELDLREHDLRGDRGRLVADLVDRIDKCRDQLVSADQYRAWADERLAGAGSGGAAHRARREVEIARVFQAHERWLAEDGREDFGLSIVRALDLLRAHPDRLEAARAAARHVLVDEFQDTNHAQAELLYLVAGGPTASWWSATTTRASTASGGRRPRTSPTSGAASPRRPSSASRSTTARPRRSSTPRRPWWRADPGPRGQAHRRPQRAPSARDPRFWRAPDPDGQARAVTQEIVRMAEAGVPLEEQAVLMRAVRLEARPVTEALERAGVPHQVRGGFGLFERREVRSAVAWLRAAADPADAQAHLRIASDRRLDVPWTAAADAVSAAAAAGRPVAGPLVEAAPVLAPLLGRGGPGGGGAAPGRRAAGDRRRLRAEGGGARRRRRRGRGPPRRAWRRSSAWRARSRRPSRRSTCAAWPPGWPGSRRSASAARAARRPSAPASRS